MRNKQIADISFDIVYLNSNQTLIDVLGDNKGRNYIFAKPGIGKTEFAHEYSIKHPTKRCILIEPINSIRDQELRKKVELCSFLEVWNYDIANKCDKSLLKDDTVIFIDEIQELINIANYRYRASDNIMNLIENKKGNIFFMTGTPGYEANIIKDCNLPCNFSYYQYKDISTSREQLLKFEPIHIGNKQFATYVKNLICKGNKVYALCYSESMMNELVNVVKNCSGSYCTIKSIEPDIYNAKLALVEEMKAINIKEGTIEPTLIKARRNQIKILEDKLKSQTDYVNNHLRTGNDVPDVILCTKFFGAGMNINYDSKDYTIVVDCRAFTSQEIIQFASRFRYKCWFDENGYFHEINKVLRIQLIWGDSHEYYNSIKHNLKLLRNNGEETIREQVALRYLKERALTYESTRDSKLYFDNYCYPNIVKTEIIKPKVVDSLTFSKDSYLIFEDKEDEVNIEFIKFIKYRVKHSKFSTVDKRKGKVKSNVLYNINYKDKEYKNLTLEELEKLTVELNVSLVTLRRYSVSHKV